MIAKLGTLGAALRKQEEQELPTRTEVILKAAQQEVDE